MHVRFLASVDLFWCQFHLLLSPIPSTFLIKAPSMVSNIVVKVSVGLIVGIHTKVLYITYIEAWVSKSVFWHLCIEGI